MVRTARAALIGLGVSLGSPALAAPTVGVQLDLANPTGGAAALGTGFSGSLGYGVDLALVEVIPQVGATWFSESQRFLPRAGGRMMIGKVVEPGVYAHVVFADGLSVAPGRAGWDAGALLDVTAIPHLDIGLHAGVLSLPSRSETPDTHITGGLHLAVVF